AALRRFCRSLGGRVDHASTLAAPAEDERWNGNLRWSGSGGPKRPPRPNRRCCMFALGRSATLVAMAAGAVGIPYMVSESGPTHSDESALIEHVDLDADPSAVSPAAVTAPGATPAPGASLTGNLSGDLAEPFRFDITPDWVFRRWQRVSTVSNLPDLQGYRVPLVTGTRE